MSSNHAAFIYGHLSLYGPKVAQFAGGSVSAIPDSFDELFSQHAQCSDDVQGTVYPEMSVITGFYFSGWRAALEAIHTSEASVWEQTNPSEGRMAEKFPSLGSLANFLVGGHMMLHLGQMSAWRRIQGLGPA